jgi:hypothetical protein
MKSWNIWKANIKLILKGLGLGKLKWFLMSGYDHIRHGSKTKTIGMTLCYYYYKTLKSSRTFTFCGKTYNYFYHRYNTTWVNERVVEIPIIWDIVREYDEERILEVGNVLSHYFPIEHDVLDKYEKADGVINEDVINFRPSRSYDLIVSISTLEHVGWDEELREPMKILTAIENLRKCIATGGKIVATLPLGQNPDMDKLLRNGKIEFTEQHFLKRISKDNEWIESTWEDIQNAEYSHPFSHANGLIVGIMEY